MIRTKRSPWGSSKHYSGLNGTPRRIMAGGQEPRNCGDMRQPFKPKGLQGKWEFGYCRDCNTKVWRRSRAMMKVNKELMRCDNCKHASRIEVHDACVALALRKKAMGLIK